MHRRVLIQIAALVLANPFISNFAQGSIYQGSLKGICVPFLNCYSCPGAVASCPLGALQNVLAAPYTRFPLYVLGFMVLIGGVAGRWICGWLCPFGFFQELLGKLSRVKLKLPRRLSWVKYAVLVVTVLTPIFWVDQTGLGGPYFCQYLCPQGTLTAGLPLVLSDPEVYSPMIGTIFWVKVFILAALLISSIFVFRPFCRVLCPLGAFYGLFNKYSLFRLNYDSRSCNNCKKCSSSCPVEINLPREQNAKDCIRCLKCRDACPVGALQWSMGNSLGNQETSDTVR